MNYSEKNIYCLQPLFFAASASASFLAFAAFLASAAFLAFAAFAMFVM
jgi:hypothetical protein